MNADATPGVDVAVKAAAQVDFLDAAGWGSIIAGLVVLSISALLAVLGIRTRPRTAVHA